MRGVEMDGLTLTLSPRDVIGKKVRALRRQGMVPVHFYGRGVDSLALQVELAALRRVLAQSGGNVPVTISIDGQDGENICFARDAQRHPVTEELLHVDFLRVDVTRTVRAEVPIILEGESPAVRDLEGTLLQPFATLEVEALPMDIPQAFRVGITGLTDFETSLRISDIVHSDNVTILRGDEEMIARVAAPRVEEALPGAELEPEEGEESAGEGEEEEPER